MYRILTPKTMCNIFGKTVYTQCSCMNVFGMNRIAAKDALNVGRVDGNGPRS